MTTTKKNAIRYIDDNTALVTKDFQKKASIFGTAEFKEWREYLKYYPEAKMTTKKITTNPDKENVTKNMTYENMAAYIREQDDAEVVMAEFEKQIKDAMAALTISFDQKVQKKCSPKNFAE